MAECPSDVCVGGVEEWMRVITSASAVEEYLEYNDIQGGSCGLQPATLGQ